MSLLASFMSAITILGTPAEIYVYGTQYWIIGNEIGRLCIIHTVQFVRALAISYVFTIYLTITLFMPMFVKLEVTSAYEVKNSRRGIRSTVSRLLVFSI